MDFSDNSLTIACTLVPIQHFDLLVPNNCVAEVLRSTKIDDNLSTNPWHIGNALWNDQEIPIISFEKLDSEYNFIQKDKSIIVVISYPASSSSKNVNFGIIANQFPQIIQANSQSIDRELTPQSQHSHALSYVYIDGKSALIPDIPRIANSLQQNLHKSVA